MRVGTPQSVSFDGSILRKRNEMETAPQMEPLEPVPVSKSIANTKSSLLPKQFRSTVLKAGERKGAPLPEVQDLCPVTQKLSASMLVEKDGKGSSRANLCLPDFGGVHSHWPAT